MSSVNNKDKIKRLLSLIFNNISVSSNVNFLPYSVAGEIYSIIKPGDLKKFIKNNREIFSNFSIEVFHNTMIVYKGSPIQYRNNNGFNNLL